MSRFALINPFQISPFINGIAWRTDGDGGGGGSNNDSSSKTVEKGETLSQIAEDNDMSIEELAAANNISNVDDIKEGQVLDLSGAGSGSSTYNNDIGLGGVGSDSIKDDNANEPVLSSTNTTTSKDMEVRNSLSSIEDGDYFAALAAAGENDQSTLDSMALDVSQMTDKQGALAAYNAGSNVDAVNQYYDNANDGSLNQSIEDIYGSTNPSNMSTSSNDARNDGSKSFENMAIAQGMSDDVFQIGNNSVINADANNAALGYNTDLGSSYLKDGDQMFKIDPNEELQQALEATALKEMEDNATQNSMEAVQSFGDILQTEIQKSEGADGANLSEDEYQTATDKVLVEQYGWTRGEDGSANAPDGVVVENSVDNSNFKPAGLESIGETGLDGVTAEDILNSSVGLGTKYLEYDLNGDGKVSSADARMMFVNEQANSEDETAVDESGLTDEQRVYNTLSAEDKIKADNGDLVWDASSNGFRRTDYTEMNAEQTAYAQMSPGFKQKVDNGELTWDAGLGEYVEVTSNEKQSDFETIEGLLYRNGELYTGSAPDGEYIDGVVQDGEGESNQGKPDGYDEGTNTWYYDGKGYGSEASYNAAMQADKELNDNAKVGFNFGDDMMLTKDGQYYTGEYEGKMYEGGMEVEGQSKPDGYDEGTNAWYYGGKGYGNEELYNQTKEIAEGSGIRLIGGRMYEGSEIFNGEYDGKVYENGAVTGDVDKYKITGQSIGDGEFNAEDIGNAAIGLGTIYDEYDLNGDGRVTQQDALMWAQNNMTEEEFAAEVARRAAEEAAKKAAAEAANNGDDNFSDTNNDGQITALEAEIANLRQQLALVTNSSTQETKGLSREEILSMITAAMKNNNASNYNPAAFMNAFGFSNAPSYFGQTIPTYMSQDGVYERRAVKDKDTGEIRYVNVPIGNASLAGTSGFQKRRREGFGNALDF
jgi:hypothetical protein